MKSLDALSVATLALLLGVGCSGMDGASPEDDEPMIDSASHELRGQRRSARSPRATASATPAQSTGGRAPGNPGWSIDPVTGVIIPPPADPNVDPNSGINYNDLSNAAVDGGGQCANNRAMSGPCANYGLQCVFEEAGVTRYCTCLFASSLGRQGWECR